MHGGPGVNAGERPGAFANTGARVELKAGTWQSEASAPGSVVFDSVKVVR